MGIDLGEGFDIVTYAGSDGRKRFAGIELGASEPVPEVVEADILGTRDSVGDPAEGLCQAIRGDRCGAGWVGKEVSQDEGFGCELGTDVFDELMLQCLMFREELDRAAVDADFSHLVALGVLDDEFAAGDLGYGVSN